MVRQNRDVELIGGRMCLDFVNTVAWRGTDEPQDALESYGDLLRWSVRAGALSRGEASELSRGVLEDPSRSRTALARARLLREAIHRVVLAWKRGRSPDATDLALVNASARARDELVSTPSGFVWAGESSSHPEKMLWRVVWSFADLVSRGDRRRLGRCGSSDCGWLFYDESRGRRRRWCSMRDCGNRAKARRHYARTHGTQP